MRTAEQTICCVRDKLQLYFFYCLFNRVLFLLPSHFPSSSNLSVHSFALWMVTDWEQGDMWILNVNSILGLMGAHPRLSPSTHVCVWLWNWPAGKPNGIVAKTGFSSGGKRSRSNMVVRYWERSQEQRPHRGGLWSLARVTRTACSHLFTTLVVRYKCVCKR